MGKPKRRRIRATAAETHLPLPVIQHIQSFLSGKHAAQTALVSKSWCNAWLTRPDLYFNQSCFDRWRPFGFWNFVKKTMQRYEESDLNINSFKLRLDHFAQGSTRAYANLLIKKVMRFCVSETDFNFKILLSDYVLPSEVLETEKIVRLSALGCKIERPLDEKKVKCSRLKSIRLESMYVEDDLLFKGSFPCLEDLTLVCCYGYDELEISGNSLKCITIVESRNFKGKFYVPNIRKFTFSGSSFPSLCLIETPKEWESDISVNHLHHGTSESWFLKLRGLLRKLSLAACKVSLNIGFYGYNCDRRGSFSSRNMPTVENLTLSLPSQFFGYDALLRTMFWSCHPKIITQYLFPKSCREMKANNELVKYLCKRLIQGRAKYGHLHGSLNGLEEVNVEIFEESLGKWENLEWQTLFNGSIDPENMQKIRFQLGWCDKRQ